MKKWIAILGVLLVAQIGLATLFNLRGDPFAAFEPQEKLLSFEPALVTELRIEAADGSVDLKKVKGQWRLPQLENFAADQGKVDKLLEKLARLEKGWPVATTAGAVRRFRVAEEDFERRITLFKDGAQVAQIYFGTSPGFRKVHARSASDNVIVAADFSLIEALARRNDWIDRNALEVPVADIVRVEMPQFTLLYEEGAWRLADLKDSETMEEKAADDLVGRLAALQIDGLYPDGEAVKKDQEGQSLSFTLVPGQGEALTYALSRLEDQNYLLTRSDRKERFKVAAWRISPIEDASRDKLVKAAEKPAADDNTPAPETGAGGDDKEAGEDKQSTAKR